MADRPLRISLRFIRATGCSVRAEGIVTTDFLPPSINADYLTQTLRKAGALTDGRVIALALDNPRDTLLSRIARLKLTYDHAATTAPASLFLKVARADRQEPSWVSGRQEVAFYSKVAALIAPGAVPHCFDASWNADTNAWHLLLEDLTDTHATATTWPLPPSLQQCEAIVGSLARIHAQWWDHPSLGTSVGALASADDLETIRQTFAEQFSRFADDIGDNLSADRRDLYRRLIEALPTLSRRYHSHRNLTVVHGDAHVWNCVLPRDGGQGARFFDWDAWRIDIATSDLAYMMAMHWYPERRHRDERPLLDVYHRVLVAHGVSGYDRRALTDDYRRSALTLLRRPVWQWAMGIPPVIWWNNLERIMMAIDDLGSRELLG
jgi:hypothetical protein